MEIDLLDGPIIQMAALPEDTPTLPTVKELSATLATLREQCLALNKKFGEGDDKVFTDEMHLFKLLNTRAIRNLTNASGSEKNEQLLEMYQKIIKFIETRIVNKNEAIAKNKYLNLVQIGVVALFAIVMIGGLTYAGINGIDSTIPYWAIGLGVGTPLVIIITVLIIRECKDDNICKVLHVSSREFEEVRKALNGIISNYDYNHRPNYVGRMPRYLNGW